MLRTDSSLGCSLASERVCDEQTRHVNQYGRRGLQSRDRFFNDFYQPDLGRWRGEKPPVGVESITLTRGAFDDRVDGAVPGPIALVLIDAIHTYEFVMRRFATSKPRMRRGGLLAVDDIDVRKPGARMRQAWIEIATSDGVVAAVEVQRLGPSSSGGFVPPVHSSFGRSAAGHSGSRCAARQDTDTVLRIRKIVMVQRRGRCPGSDITE